MIIQGDNKPIVVEMSGSVADLEYFSGILYGKTTYKTWDLDDIETEGNTLKLPLTQSETLAITENRVVLEVKFVANGDIQFVDDVSIYVKNRKDSTVFPIEGGDSDAD